MEKICSSVITATNVAVKVSVGEAVIVAEIRSIGVWMKFELKDGGKGKSVGEVLGGFAVTNLVGEIITIELSFGSSIAYAVGTNVALGFATHVDRTTTQAADVINILNFNFLSLSLL